VFQLKKWKDEKDKRRRRGEENSQVSYVRIFNFVGIFWGLGKLYIFEN